MRDPKRIHPVITNLEKYWKMHPDWRLGQLICNIARMFGHYDSFFMEDTDLLNFLHQLIDEETAENNG